jgi:hypothetical protein
MISFIGSVPNLLLLLFSKIAPITATIAPMTHKMGHTRYINTPRYGLGKWVNESIIKNKTNANKPPAIIVTPDILIQLRKAEKRDLDTLSSLAILKIYNKEFVKDEQILDILFIPAKTRYSLRRECLLGL